MKKLVPYFTVAFLCVAVFVTSWALLRPGMFKIHDFVHGARIVEMSRALADGHIPARWGSNFGYGYGMPLFEFYAPLPYLLGALFYMLGIPLVSSVKLLFLIATVGTVVGGYYLGKSLFDSSWAGVVTSFALTLAPYRALNLFVRGAVSEAWGMMALPWIVYGFLSLRHSLHRGFGILVVSFCILFLSHNLTTLIAVPFLFAFFAIYLFSEHTHKNSSKKSMSWKQLLTGGAAFLLAIGVSAFYLFPAFLEKDFTQINEAIVGDYFNYNLHFLYIRQFFDFAWGYGGSEWGPDDPISFFLGFGQWFGIIIFGIIVLKRCVVLFKQKRIPLLLSKSHVWILAGTVTLLLGSLYMTLQRSEPIWASIPLLQYVQFPWRFLSVASFFASILVASPLSMIKSKGIQMGYFFTVMALLVVGNTLYFKPEAVLDDPKGLYYAQPEKIQVEMSGILPDYISKDLNLEQIVIPPLEGIVCMPECAGKTELVKRTHERLYTVDATTQTLVEFSIAAFPGWTVEVDGVVYPHEVTSRGTIALQLPAGSHLVGIQLRGTPIRNTSDVITVVSLVVCLYVLYQFDSRKLVRKST